VYGPILGEVQPVLQSARRLTDLRVFTAIHRDCQAHARGVPRVARDRETRRKWEARRRGASHPEHLAVRQGCRGGDGDGTTTAEVTASPWRSRFTVSSAGFYSIHSVFCGDLSSLPSNHLFSPHKLSLGASASERAAE